VKKGGKGMKKGEIESIDVHFPPQWNDLTHGTGFELVGTRVFSPSCMTRLLCGFSVSRFGVFDLVFWDCCFGFGAFLFGVKRFVMFLFWGFCDFVFFFCLVFCDWCFAIGVFVLSFSV
jgi:hypothetical protein